MKTSNIILTVYVALLVLFVFGPLGLNVREYRVAGPAMRECVEGLQAAAGRSVVVVDPGTAVAVFPEDDRAFMVFSRGRDVPRARVSGDTLFVEGASYLTTSSSVRRIIRGGETIEVPSFSEWKGGGEIQL